MSNTKIGRIYKIIHTQSDICYVGSTFNTLRDRFYNHRSDYTKWLNGKKGQVSIYPYFKEHGIEQFKIILIKEYEVVDKKHLEVYEQLWINKLCKSVVNKFNSFYIKKLYDKQYRENNKEKISEKKKEYHRVNKEKILERKQLYREANKDKIKEYDRQRNKDEKRILWKREKMTCDCGAEHTRGVKAKHLKTKKHQNWLSSQ